MKLARAHGVMTEYVDWRGRPVQVSAETIESVLAALGVDTSDPERARQQKEHEPWLRMLPATVVTVVGEPTWVPVHVSTASPSRCGSSSRTGAPGRPPGRPLGRPREIDGQPIGEATFEVPADLPLGYHRLRARSR